MKSRTTALILAFFLGGLGAHKFYLDKPVTGLFYLLFFWTFIPAFIAFFEFLGFAFQSDETFNETYNKNRINPSTAKNPTEELSALAALFEKNLLTKDEFDLKKTELLRKIG